MGWLDIRSFAGGVQYDLFPSPRRSTQSASCRLELQQWRWCANKRPTAGSELAPESRVSNGAERLTPIWAQTPKTSKGRDPARLVAPSPESWMGSRALR
jgi:hypothetical protein